MGENIKILLSVVLICPLLFNAACSGSCDGVGSIAYAVNGNITLSQARAEETEKQTEADAGAEAGVEGNAVDVAIVANVLVNAGPNTTTLTVLNLKMTTASGKILENPAGIEEPVVFNPDEKPALKNLIIQEGDDDLSVEVKKIIINMLPQQEKNVTSYSDMEDMLNLLEEGKEKIILSDEYKNLTLILGNTGSGKSTFTSWIADTDNVLVSKELPGGDFIIEDDKGKISNETISSKTTFPELVVDFAQNVTYYDMPGFSDTRSSTNDIAASFFTTSVIEHANNIKLIFLINYSSVRKGNDRNDFVLFLHHVTELINDIDKFKNSIALVVTKVENKYVRGALVDDEAVRRGVAAFMEEVKKVLENKLTDDLRTSSEETAFYDKSIKLIDIFLTEEDGVLLRLGIFRRPDDSGVLNEMNFLEVEKNDVRDMIINNVIFTDSRPGDFGRTISEKSRNDISSFMDDVEKNILFNVCQLSNTIEQNVHKIILTSLNENISIVNTSDPIEADAILNYAFDIFNDVDSILTTLTKLVDEIKQELFTENIPELIIKRVISFNSNIPKKLITDIANEGKYLKFLMSSSKEEFTIRLSQFAWASAFQSIIPALTSETNIIKQKVNTIDKLLERQINTEIKLIGENLMSKYNAMEINISSIARVHEFLKSKVNIINSLMTSKKQFVSNVFDCIDSENITYAQYLTTYISRKEKHLLYLKSTLSEILFYLEESQKFYHYLLNLFELLLNSDPVENKSECIKNIKNIDTFILYENKEISSNSLERYLDKCLFHDSLKLSDEIRLLNLNKARLWYLKEVLNLLFAVTHTCEAEIETMTVKGFNIKISDVVSKNCQVPVKNIRVFTLNTILIDDDFIKLGTKSLAIVSPKWIVQGVRLINLNGLPGKPHEPRKAKNGEYAGNSGEDGLEGNPGGNGGMFIGIGDQFNTENLTITVNGGDGGPGQEGGDGADGRDGTSPNIQDAGKFLENIGWYNDGSKYQCYFFGCDYDPISGRHCTNGGNGGKGGVGGYGGYRGNLEFLSTNTKPDVRVIYKEGHAGESGRSGHGGDGGQPGLLARVNWKWIRFWDTTKVVDYEKNRQCFKGITPSNNVYQMSSSRSVSDYFQLLSASATLEITELDVLSKYIKFVTENDIVMSSVTQKFLERLQSTDLYRNPYI